MFSTSNKFLNTLNSFKSVCLNLEGNSDKKIVEIAKQCTDEFSSGAKTLTVFHNYINGINKTCTELTNVDEIIRLALKKVKEPTIVIPYELQNDFLKCIGELYRKSHDDDDENEKSLKNDGKVLSDIIESSQENLIQIKDIIHVTEDMGKKNLL